MNSIIKKVVSFILTAAFIIAILPPMEIFAADITYSGGAGTKTNPYLVSNMQDLLNVEHNSGKYFLQTCDISMAGRTFSKNPISTFSGTYDGGGHAISNLKIDGYDEWIGLFGLLFGTIKNLNIENCDVTASFIYAGDGICGAIAGHIYESGKVIGCSVSGKLYAKTNASNTGKYLGGVAGVNQGEIIDCRNSATITIGAGGASDMYAGGIAGNNNTTIKNCYNEGKIEVLNGRNSLAAGIAAINFGTISATKNIASVYAYNSLTYDGYRSDSYAAGIAAYNKGTVSYGYNSGYIKAESAADNAEAGGITSYTGGAYTESGYVVEYSKNVGDVTAHSTAGESRAGGISGTLYSGSYIRYCCNEGDISATENKKYNLAMAGGIAACVQYGTVMQSCNHGDVTVTATKYTSVACGIGDGTDAVMTDCYNTGNIYPNGSDSEGAMLFKDSNTTCVNCYSVGTFPSTLGRRYGLYAVNGWDSNIIENCFTTASINTKSSAIMTAEQSKIKGTYTGYDFVNVWDIDPEINNGCPYLRNVPNDDSLGWYIVPEERIPVTGIQIAAAPFSVNLGQRIQLVATVLPENATNKKIHWSVRDSHIASVDQNGVVTVIGYGLTYVYAQSDDGGYKTSYIMQCTKYTDQFSGGTGTQSNPYIVTTAAQLQNVMYYPTSHFRQAANISLEGVDFIPIGTSATPFSGSYDGNGYSISDLTINVNDDRAYVGLFAYVTGKISNVKLKNFDINVSLSSGDVYVAALAAYSKNYISNCHVNADINVTALSKKQNIYVGGLVGYMPENSIYNSSFSGKINAKVTYVDSIVYAGGIVGYGQTVSSSQNYGEVFADGAISCDSYVGGIIGYAENTISNCYNKGKISSANSKYSTVGGIAGCNKSTMSKCENDGEIFASTAYNATHDTSYTYAGGISGSNYGLVSYCRNYGLIHSASTATYAYAGGIVGYNQANATITYSKNYGEVKAGSQGAESRAGGIASTSYSDSLVKYCCNYGNVSIYDNALYNYGSAGGVVAVLQYGTVEECCNHGTVTIDSTAYEPYGCGIAGFTDSVLKNCYSDGVVHSNFKYINSYSPGMICGIGDGCGTPITNCYFSGQLTSKYSYTERYGLIWTNGRGGNSMSGCYTLNLYSSTENASKMTPETSKLQATYAGYDFNNIWAIDPAVNEGRPYLRNIPSDNSNNWYSGTKEQISLDGHKIGEWILVSATCYSEGILRTGCVYCGMVIEDEMIPMTSHTYEDWTVSSEPTCESDGYKYRYCTECGNYDSDVIDSLGHDLEHHLAKAPTCTEIGWKAYDTCNRCDYTTYEEIPANGHDYEHKVTEPTCTEQGYTTHTCHCGDSYIDSYVSAKGHSFGEWIITKAPTCTDKGEEERSCACGETESREVDELGHDLEHHLAKAPTCTEIGWKAYDTCNRCDYTTYEELPANGHDYEHKVTEPTCTEQGYTTHTCHCGDSYVDSYVSAKGHSFGEWIITKAPTCTDKGEEERSCACGETESREVDELGHDIEHHLAKAPTCTEIGWNDYDTCSRCDYSTYEELPANGHDYNSVITPPTDEQGYTTHTCKVCGYSYTDSYTDPIYRRGDLNRDGKIDVDDVLLCLDLAFVFPTAEQLKTADLDENGVINVNDVLMCLDLCFAIK